MHAQHNVLRTVAAALIATAITIPAFAQTAGGALATPSGQWMLGARVLDVYPNVSSSNSGFDVENQWTGEFDSTYFFTRNVAVEGSITWAKQDVTVNGTGVGALKMMPVTFTVQYHFTDLGAWKPYVGGGFNYTYFYENELGKTPELPSTATAGAARCRRASTTNSNGIGISTPTSSTFGLTMTCA